MLLKDLRSADFGLAHVPRKERWASIIRVEAPVGSLKCRPCFEILQMAQQVAASLRVDGCSREAVQ